MADHEPIAKTYSAAYKFAMHAGIGHDEAVRHATYAVRAAEDEEGVYLCALASGCAEPDARHAARSSREPRRRAW